MSSSSSIHMDCICICVCWTCMPCIWTGLCFLYEQKIWKKRNAIPYHSLHWKYFQFVLNILIIVLWTSEKLFSNSSNQANLEICTLIFLETINNIFHCNWPPENTSEFSNHVKAGHTFHWSLWEPLCFWPSQHF